MNFLRSDSLQKLVPCSPISRIYMTYFLIFVRWQNTLRIFYKLKSHLQVGKNKNSDLPHKHFASSLPLPHKQNRHFWSEPLIWYLHAPVPVRCTYLLGTVPVDIPIFTIYSKQLWSLSSRKLDNTNQWSVDNNEPVYR